ncbi:MAG: hypothetical protein IJF36_00020, partial [Oscillibacter sp.]|nr:hypothetical protein [Oscillibacter sp.]
CYSNSFHLACQVLFSKFFDFRDPTVIRSNFFKLPHSNAFVKHFFDFSQKFRFSNPRRRLIGDSLLRLPRRPPFFNTFFHFSF